MLLIDDDFVFSNKLHEHRPCCQLTNCAIFTTFHEHSKSSDRSIQKEIGILIVDHSEISYPLDQ